MKKICGFLDKKGNFHKTKKKAEYADLKYKIEFIEKSLDNYGEKVTNIVFEKTKYVSEYDERSYINRLKEDILQSIGEQLLKNNKEWTKIIKDFNSLKKELILAKAEKKVKWWYKFL